jgi:PIN domain-containing protein
MPSDTPPMTSTRILVLFPDTNLFVQCRPLHELDWAACGDHDEIHLIVSRPVQEEIDDHKNRGNERLAKRARTTSSLFRAILIDAAGCKEVKSAPPKIKVFISRDTSDNTLAPSLDPTQEDDQLVIAALTYRRDHPDADVWLLSHDTGPIASARVVGLPFIPIPDTWLLPPEKSEAERRAETLARELDRLKKAEPAFEVQCIDPHSNVIQQLNLQVIRYHALTDTEIQELITRIQQRYPVVTDFGPDTVPDPGATLKSTADLKRVFVPPHDDDIAAYRDRAYPQWLSSCETFLRKFHLSQQAAAPEPVFTFAITNTGSRPAKDALITFTARGKFSIKPPSHTAETALPRTPTGLPPPPPAPTGEWQLTLSGLENFARLQKLVRKMAPALPTRDFLPSIHTLTPPPKRDPNAFYYKPSRPQHAAAEFTLECQQWRHGLEPELFVGEIHLTGSPTSISAALQCQIHAENMSDVVQVTVPVRITINSVRSHEAANAQVDTFVAPSVEKS